MCLVEAPMGSKGEGSGVWEGRDKVGKNGQATLKPVPSLGKIKRKK